MKFHLSHPKALFDPNLQGKFILSGNEAFARGLFEQSVQFLATYPGTPASEIGNLWDFYSRENSDVYFDLSVNETVAFEAAVGAAWSGVRAAVSFKHLGMNLITDALHAVMYSGIDGKRKAGLVILVGGDPDINSSTNAVDVRLFSYHSQLPILEPSSIQECKDIVADAFLLSETIELPVMIYFPSQLAHASGEVAMSPVSLEMQPYSMRRFEKNPDRFLNAIHWAKRNQASLYAKIHQLNHGFFETLLDTLYSELKGQSTGVITKTRIKFEPPEQELSDQDESVTFEREPLLIGFIGSGLGWTVIEELALRVKIDFPRLRLKLTYPIPLEPILSFLEKFEPDVLIIIEDLEPFLERQIREILYEIPAFIPIVGKKNLPRVGVLTPDIVHSILAKPLVIQEEMFFLQEFQDTLRSVSSTLTNLASQIPIREPTFCPGCSHRNVFYALRKAVDLYKKKTGREAIVGGDIGCYTMGMSKPYELMDWLICMGAGVGIANGVSQVVDPQSQHVIALVGDSTFFHSGLQSLINLVKHGADVLVVILDNYYCAMTGHQLSPSTPIQLQANSNIETNNPISILDLLHSLRDFEIQNFDGYSIKAMKNQFLDLFNLKGIKVALVQAECALQKKRRKDSLSKLLPNPNSTFLKITEDCTKCNECIYVLGCTAIVEQEGKYIIDNSRCLGELCLSCLEVCAFSAIQIIKNSTEDNSEVITHDKNL
ncbi:MAG: thiamine pyrophosphate-dependent enzyme [Promethearchaeota archaeon]